MISTKMLTRCKQTKRTKQGNNNGAGAKKSTSKLLNIPELSIERSIKQKLKKMSDDAGLKAAKKKKSDTIEKQKLTKELSEDNIVTKIEENPEKSTSDGNPPKKSVGRPRKIKLSKDKPENTPIKRPVGRPKSSASIDQLKKMAQDNKAKITTDTPKIKYEKNKFEGEKENGLKRKLKGSASIDNSPKKRKIIKTEKTLSENQISTLLSDSEYDSTKDDQKKSVKKTKSREISKPAKYNSSDDEQERKKSSKSTSQNTSNKKDKKIVLKSKDPLESTKLGRKPSPAKSVKKETKRISHTNEAKPTRDIACKKTSSNDRVGQNMVMPNPRVLLEKATLDVNKVIEKNRPKDEKKVKKSIEADNKSGKESIGDIKQTIGEMQEKIKKLEKKSILDEKKIDMFRKAVLQQRKADLRTLMDETENELLSRVELLYQHYDPQRICRLCLLLIDKKECHTSLACNQQLIAMVQDTTSIQVNLVDGMPSGICRNCLEQIEQLDWTKRRIKTSNKLLEKFLLTRKDLGEPRRELTASPVLVEKPQIPDNISESSAEVKIEDVFSLNGCDDDASSTSSEELELRNTMIKKNAIMKQKERARSYRMSLMNMRKGYRCEKCRTVFLNRWSLNSHHDYCRKKIKCFECGKCFWHMHWYIKHKKQRVLCISKKKNRSCRPCQVTCRWKWQKSIHILLHDLHICQVCDKTLFSEKLLKEHVLKQHMDLGFF